MDTIKSDPTSRGGLEERIVQYIQVLNRLQQTYSLEHNNKFATSLTEFDFNLLATMTNELDEYYKISSQITNNAFYSYALPYSDKITISTPLPPPLGFIKVTSKKDIKAFVSVLTLNKTDRWLEVICASETPGITQPLAPIIKDNRLMCSPGTVEFEE